MELPLSGSSITDVRVSIKASTTQGLVAAHASIGLSAMTDDGSCTATPAELLFGGVSGINVGVGVVAVSDWVALSGLSASVNAMVTVDFTTGGTVSTTSPTGNNKLWYHNNTSNPGYYATASGAGLSPSSNDNRMVVLIETR